MKELFTTGNEACAEGALIAQCRFFAGYPITPSSEIMEALAAKLPLYGGTFIQMEDEIAALAAILGASAAGVKSMTATSGPGFSLMMENIGLGAMMEIPCVIVDVMRAGPSTGLPTLVGQGDVMQARWGSHGDYEIIALSPSSVQEMFDLTIKAFNLSERYRVPVILLADEVVGHMTEKVVIPDSSNIKLYKRRKPSKAEKHRYIPFKSEKDLVSPMADAGEGFRIHYTGLTHDEMGYPMITPSAQEWVVRKIVDKIRLNADSIVEWREYFIEDADVVVVSYGITARVALAAVQHARKKGVKAGLIQLITIWPFCEKILKKIASQVSGIVVAEINYGQIVYEVERCVRPHYDCDIILVPKLGGDIHTPADILKGIMDLCKR
jgi:2-oxoglutarate ferredoxin oxidoreductase subunit alpha